MLFFAALLHDIGKDIGGKSHDERGREMARVILERLGLPESDIREVQQLIWKHLRMYHVATRRDIDDPRTLEAFCEEVHGREGLRELYILDHLRRFHDQPDRAHQLEVARAGGAVRQRRSQLSTGKVERGGERTEQIRAEVRALCPQRGELEFLNHFLATMPDRYLYSNDPQDIVRHSRFARQAQMQHVNVTVMTTGNPVRGARLHCRRSSRTAGDDHRHLGRGPLQGDQRAGLLLGRQLWSHARSGFVLGCARVKRPIR